MVVMASGFPQSIDRQSARLVQANVQADLRRLIRRMEAIDPKGVCIDEIAANLELGESGIWFSKGNSEVSYPSAGNESCFEIEGHSFWFQHRNRCINTLVRGFPPAGAIFDLGGGNGFVSL